jgi:hypothetical protein
LPKGGNVGFELMENQKLGVSQFLEQVNFQRALEGELAKSIESVAPSRRRASTWPCRNRPCSCATSKTDRFRAADLHPGRGWTSAVSAIVHLVASSVPDCCRPTSPWSTGRQPDFRAEQQGPRQRAKNMDETSSSTSRTCRRR